MRMWMIPPWTLCRQHLLGEHRELHTLAGHLRKGRRLGRYATDRLVNPAGMHRRHDALVGEMIARGYQHKSPLDLRGLELPVVEIDEDRNLQDLYARCERCRKRSKE